MMDGRQNRPKRPWAWLLCCLGAWLWVFPCPAANTLNWRTHENRVDADITTWDVQTLLEHIASATGWEVFIEPGTKYAVSTKFKDRTPGEALRMLLPTVTTVLMPQTNGTSRLLVFRTSAQEATQLVKPLPTREDPTAKPIPNELVVTLKPGAKIDDIARKYGAKVIGRADGLNSYRLAFDSAEAAQAAREEMANDPDVRSIDSNFWMRPPEDADAMSANIGNPFTLKPIEGSECNSSVIGLIDTAIQPTGGSLDAFLLPPVSVAGDAKVPSDQPTHATSMFETILRGISLQDKETPVKVLPVDVYGSQTTTTTFDVANGISQAINKGAGIINLSLGSSGDSQLLRDLIKTSSEKGVLFMAAAGNEPGTAPTYPAAYPEVLAVTAGGRDGTVAAYANSGDFVDLAAPGNSMVNFNGRSWVVTGTSASTAYASGIAAGMWDCGKMTRAQVTSAMQSILPVKRQP